jgi:ubiquinone/menaquinone biosynthesis C-methylase UbiE/DNA-binding transcriptional ArsR family regulator
MDMKSASALYRLLGDEARLRILRLLAAERLNVSELTAVLGIAQSGVSRHLGLLKESGLVEEQREGGFTYYRATLDAGNGRGAVPGDAANGHRAVWGALAEQFAASAGDTTVRADDARLKEVLRLRKESFATHGGAGRQLVPGRSWAAWSRALGLLLPPLEVADLGCGDGYLTIEAARWAARVVAIDRSPEVLGRGRELAARRGVRNITWKRGELESLPLPDASVDVALLSQALHHAEHPPVALAEAVRILRPGGRVLVLDLRSHDQAWVHDRLGDRVRGFKDEELARLLEEAGLAHVQVRVGARLEGDPFTVLIAAGSKNPDCADRKESPHETPSVTARVRSGRR